MKNSEIYALTYNPYYLYKLLHYFLSGVQSVNSSGIKSELIYLVLPFLFDDKIKDRLAKLKSNSKLNTITEDKENGLFLSQLNKNIQSLKKNTSEAIIILSNYENLSIETYMHVDEAVSYKNEKNQVLKNDFKAAYNLGLMFAKEQYKTIFKKLRILL